MGEKTAIVKLYIEGYADRQDVCMALLNNGLNDEG